jgi:hypothetical protein
VIKNTNIIRRIWEVTRGRKLEEIKAELNEKIKKIREEGIDKE